MNIFSLYRKKIFKRLKKLEKEKIIKIPSSIKSFTVELPPKNQSANISCNAALILAKINKKSPIQLAEVLKKHLMKSFKEFDDIEIAGPGFLNIYFNSSFWKKYLANIIKLGSKYGSNNIIKKKIQYRICFC